MNKKNLLLIFMILLFTSLFVSCNKVKDVKLNTNETKVDSKIKEAIKTMKNNNLTQEEAKEILLKNVTLALDLELSDNIRVKNIAGRDYYLFCVNRITNGESITERAYVVDMQDSTVKECSEDMKLYPLGGLYMKSIDGPEAINIVKNNVKLPPNRLFNQHTDFRNINGEAYYLVFVDCITNGEQITEYAYAVDIKGLSIQECSEDMSLHKLGELHSY